MKAALKEKEEKEVGHHWNRGANQGMHMYHTSVISSPLSINGVLHNQ
jgi:hypothetical protein